MAVSTIALYASPFRYSFPASSSSKPVIGGLSCLLSSPAVVKHVPLSSSFSSGGEEDELKKLSSSYSYSPSKFVSSWKKNHQIHSPVSVFQSPVSCSSSSSNGAGSDSDGDSGVDELTFNLEDTFLEGCFGFEFEPYAKKLLMSAQLKHKIFCDEFVIKAFCEAEKAHRGQMRASGDPYLQHCLETALLLALIGANSTVVAAGLLHDTLDDAFLTYDYIFGMFGAGVADLVEGVSNLSHIIKLAQGNNTASKSVDTDRLHSMFLTMADPRAVLIKLADRLHNMMTLDALPVAKQQRFAKETVEIFAPLSNRLGISNWKEQLENLCFKHLKPLQHKELSSKLVELYDDAMIASAIERLEQALKDEGISYHVIYGRRKSLYSVYAKMLKKKLTIDDIDDIHGLCLIVEKEEDCYKAINVVHQLWSEVHGKLKDYIRFPKRFNGYRSLHTWVIGEGKVPLEVQVRTNDYYVSQLSHLSKLARDNNTASKSVEADRLHSMFLAMADARAVLIKLADRLHNMMTLDAFPVAKQQRFAKETLEIFAPLANRLRVSGWKEQLENLGFKHLNPVQHKELSLKLVELYDDAMIASAIERLEQALKDEGISYHVLYGRHMNLYSIYRKMLVKKLTIDDINDIHCLRLIVEKEEDCYKAVNVVHQLWSEVRGKLKDYIRFPKRFNGYQSLHTGVIGEGKVPLEVQVLTKDYII